MDGSDRKYNAEYVELKTTLATIEAKVGNIESYMRDVQRDMAEIRQAAQKNRVEIASLKTAASVLGAVAGMVAGVVGRMLGK
jgi:septation ring formation regulator EzrA